MPDSQNEAAVVDGGTVSRAYALKPIHYDLTMAPDLGTSQFRGVVKIEYDFRHRPIRGLTAC